MYARVLLGVAASVSGSLGHSLGMTLQKRAHMRLEARGTGRALWRSRQWQLGLALYLLSSTVPPAIALSLLPVFVAAPLAAVGLVANAVFARCILHSSFARTDAFGTLLVSAGSGCVALFGAIDEPPLSLDELLRLYRRPVYVGFFVVFAGLVSLLVLAELYWRRRYARLKSRAGDRSSSSLFSSEAAPAPNVPLGSVSATHLSENQPLLAPSQSSTPTARYAATPEPAADGVEVYHSDFYLGEADVLSCEAKTTRAVQNARYASGFLSALVSGLICSQTLLLAKSGIGLVLLTLRGHMQFNDPLALAIVIGLVATALANLYYIQRALRLCSTLTVVPLSYCSSSLSALFSSLVYFDQVRLLTPIQISMIAAGVVLLAVGVLFLSLKADSHEAPLRLAPESDDED
ncbi:hypothetical protein GGF46_002917 [Coemansia sp. RSA 552]|nr:hypothetical protein GGF46_002917 [Coemansia sp. RSA 552]